MKDLQKRRVAAHHRRWLVPALLVAAVNCYAADESPVRSINVNYDGETYVCDAVMFAPVQQLLAWEVLTDFEHMAQWVPNVRETIVLRRDASSATIEQHGVARYGAVSLPYATERRMELDKPVAIRSAQVRGSLRRVESLMTLESEGSGTRLTYHLEIVPSAVASVAMSAGYLEREIPEQFNAIIAEMVRRAR
jgi:hypothetical protein